MGRTNALLTAITEAQTRLIRNQEPRVLFEGLLAALLSLTESEYGFIGEVHRSAEGIPRLKTFALTNIAWDDATRRFYAENAPGGLVFENLDTLFGVVLRTGEPVFSNSPQTDPRSGGLPPGHPPLNSFMGLPFHAGHEMIGMVGVANRPQGYDKRVANFLRPFLSACANIISAHRAQRELRRSEELHTILCEHLPEAVVTVTPGGRVIKANPAAERLFLAGDSLSGMKVEQLFDANVDTVELFSGTHGRPATEVMARRLNGAAFPLELSVAVTTGEDGPVYTAVGRDISDRRRAAEAVDRALTTAQGLFAGVLTVLDRLSIGTIHLDERGRVTFVSDACSNLLVEGGLGQRWSEALLLDDSTKQFLADRLARRAAAHFLIESGDKSFEAELLRDPREDGGFLLCLQDVSEVRRLRHEVATASPTNMIGESEPMLRLYSEITALAESDLNTLIEGETGVGKELVARALHAASARKSSKFVAVNCALLSPELVGSQLFGHVRGAFTGAISDHAGFFEAADGGTIFLDEIGDLPLAMQTALLRVLETGEVQRIGEGVTRVVDVRVIAATNQRLTRAVAEGRFRDDLYYRLKVGRITVPPLRERASDIPMLVAFFLASIRARTGRQVAMASTAANELMQEYPWPGNVRELKHAIEFAVARCAGPILEPHDLPEEIRRAAPLAPSSVRPRSEREQIIDALRTTGGNRAKAARLLKMPRSTFYRRLRELELVDWVLA